MYQERFYRKDINLKGLVYFNACIKETDLYIGADLNLYKEAIESIKKYRSQIENYINKNIEFKNSLKPIKNDNYASEIIKRMIDSSSKANVGPMAAVAGAVSEMVGMDLLNYSKEVIVENGGDIFIHSLVDRKIGLFAGDKSMYKNIGLLLKKELMPMGVCTSAGTIGHSYSKGTAEAVVVISKSTFLADAVATSIGNLIKSDSDIEDGIEFGKKIEGIEGILIKVNGKIGMWGIIELIQLG